MNLLIELGCEELPAQGLTELAGQLRDGVAAGLKKRGLSFHNAAALWTPRRLVVQVFNLALEQAAQLTERRGPALAAALSDGAPSKALLGFAASCSVNVEALEKLETDKGSWFVHRASVPGRATTALIPEVLAEALASLAIPKPMRWGDSTEAFLRPVHWLVVLADADVVPCSAFGIHSGRISYGHRFLAPAAIELAHADDYVAALLAAKVQTDPAARAQIVRDGVQALAQELDGRAEIRASLLDEVVNLTEWPVPLLGRFDAAFLSVPPEVITLTMRTNQKYFACTDVLAYDLAIALAAWGFDAEGAALPDAIAAFQSGYESIRPLSPAERSALPELGAVAAVRFTLTRLHDRMFHDPNAIVTPKDPAPFLRRLDWWTRQTAAA